MKTPASLIKLLLPALVTATFAGCASVGHLATPSGRPEIRIPKSLFRKAPVAITSYNLSKGRELDQARESELVTYEAVKAQDGTPQVTRKFVYDLIPSNDSVVITSKQVPTTDLDDDDASEDAAQPTLEAQQQELQQIVSLLQKLGTFDEESVKPEENSNDNVQQTPSR